MGCCMKVLEFMSCFMNSWSVSPNTWTTVWKSPLGLCGLREMTREEQGCVGRQITAFCEVQLCNWALQSWRGPSSEVE